MAVLQRRLTKTVEEPPLRSGTAPLLDCPSALAGRGDDEEEENKEEDIFVGDAGGGGRGRGGAERARSTVRPHSTARGATAWGRRWTLLGWGGGGG